MDYFDGMLFKIFLLWADRFPSLASHRSLTLAALALLCSLPLAACRTAPPLGPVNLKDPGWTIRQGQAVWKRKRDAPEIAGELLVATRKDGRALVQFTKNPFPLIIAQSAQDAWEVRVPMQNRFYSGHGKPPSRLIWLYLPRMLSGTPPPKGWSWRSDSNGWKLENGRTGESLEGYFS